ncbi:hypothetical protein BLNAU_8219 [Blattamonas nauphoetae]|uniref:Uncharacterized protein n=1 Tax=Blattamonas nauphoetae TaxID=2049346 RepID=A0ABQ9XZ63_9EUKA|nr:hypothetical protein BLNAU_8219 [Blattamonas nauphoetae]
MEPSLIQLRHSLDISYLFECDSTLGLLARIFEVSAFHQPTLDFICSSPIPMVYQALLSKVETEDTTPLFIGLMSDNIRRWETEEAETVRRGRILLQMLERGGFLEGLEQELLHSASAEEGRKVRLNSCEFLNLLGMNSPRPE